LHDQCPPLFSLLGVYLVTTYRWFVVVTLIVLALFAITRWLRNRAAYSDRVREERFHDAKNKAREKLQEDNDEITEV
jgi:uncharacterized membrane protein